tara:strand:+ start:716 stop:907 length:192 start_codon:yes stop_codon:yes gene_type:complete
MKASDLTNKSTDELKQDLLGLLKEQFNLRLRKTTGQLNQSHLLRQTRRDIARIKTVLTQKAGE